ncbi:MAG: hypothetical protein Q4D53_08155 [Leptotrichiaceae bacterium]|nr:hypothetical protein [Leptotrichiaceae bacterium]
MEIEEKRMREIKSLIYLKGYSISEIMEKFGYNSYEGFKRAIRKNRKNRYEEVLNFLKQ